MSPIIEVPAPKDAGRPSGQVAARSAEPSRAFRPGTTRGWA